MARGLASVAPRHFRVGFGGGALFVGPHASEAVMPHGYVQYQFCVQGRVMRCMHLDGVCGAGVLCAGYLLRRLAARAAGVGATEEAPQFIVAAAPPYAPTKPRVMVQGAPRPPCG